MVIQPPPAQAQLLLQSRRILIEGTFNGIGYALVQRGFDCVRPRRSAVNTQSGGNSDNYLVAVIGWAEVELRGVRGVLLASGRRVDLVSGRPLLLGGFSGQLNDHDAELFLLGRVDLSQLLQCLRFTHSW